MQNNKANDEHFWSSAHNSSSRLVWTGLAFERVCFQHLPQIKQAMGISGIVTNTFAFRQKGDETDSVGISDRHGDRPADHVINLCEMKFPRRTLTPLIRIMTSSYATN